MIANLIYWITERRWLFVAFATGALLFLLPPPSGLSMAGYRTLVIVVVALVLIVFEPIPLPAVAMLILAFEVIFGIASPDMVAKSFMSDAVFFIMGSLMLAVSIVKQGLDTRLALGIIRLTGNKTWKLVAGFTTISALLSSFIGEHTVAAMLLPVALTLIHYADRDPRKVTGLTSLLLFSIAYGSTIGSIGTPSGGGRNVIMLEYWSQFGIHSITYLEWMKYAYPILLFEIPLTVLILWWTFKPEKKILDTGVRKLVVKVAKSGRMTARQILAIFVFVLIFLGWVFLSDSIGLGIVALIGVFLYLALGLVEWEDLNRNTNWGVIVLFGAAISMGFQMRQTGAAMWIAHLTVDGLSSVISNLPAIRGTVAVVLTTVLSNLMSSSATVAMIGPIVLNMGGDPVVMGFTTAISSAFGYFTVVAAPACMIVYSCGLLRAVEFVKAGWKMALMSIVVLILVSQLWWPLLR
ncbi:MAG: DASS family sodium-coupled anion symporter [Candidatus Neomarinimicrobiota bacterium]